MGGEQPQVPAADQKAWARHYRRGWWAGVQHRDKQLDGLDEWQGTAYLTGYTAGEKAREQLNEGCKVEEYYQAPSKNAPAGSRYIAIRSDKMFDLLKIAKVWCEHEDGPHGNGLAKVAECPWCIASFSMRQTLGGPDLLKDIERLLDKRS